MPATNSHALRASSAPWRGAKQERPPFSCRGRGYRIDGVKSRLPVDVPHLCDRAVGNLGREGRRVVVKVMALVGIAILGTGCMRYVSLGDSYVAGPNIPKQQADSRGCARSYDNYPHLTARSLDGAAVLHDVSCIGATTGDMTRPELTRGGWNPPQLDALALNTRVVSLTIGANDIGFMKIAYSCSSIVNSGTPCQRRYVVNGDDRIADRIAATAPRIAAVLRRIHTRAPRAKVFVLGYLDIFPEDGHNCFGQLRFTDRDMPYLRDKEKVLNATIKFVTVAGGAVFVDAYAGSVGHDACQPPAVRWVEPLVPVKSAAPLHPNATGMQATANMLLAAIHKSGV